MDSLPKKPSPFLLRHIFHLGIRQKVALILFAALFIALTFSSWLAFQSQRENILRETDVRGAELTYFIAEALADDVVGYNYHSIELWLKKIVKNEDIAHIKVLSAKGNVIAEAGPGLGDAGEKMAVFNENIRVNNEVVGRLVLGLTTKRIAQTLQQQRSAYIKREAIVILLIVSIVFLAMSYFILRPINRISRVIGELRSAKDEGPAPAGDRASSSGDSASAGALAPPERKLAIETLPVTVGDEIGDLARAFVRLQRRTDEAMEGLSRSERKNRALVEAIPDMMLRLSRDGICLDCKIPHDLPAAIKPQRLVGRHIREVMPGEVGNTLLEHINRALTTRQAQLFHYVQEGDGGLLNFEARVTVGTDDEILVIVRDITEHKHLEERIRFLAHFDSLTHLPNRVMFKERLNTTLEQARQRSSPVAVLLMDLDNFKIVNDTLGHDAGDLLLQGVAERLQRCLRTSDFIARPEKGEAGATISRAGGDEFTILLTRIVDAADVMQATRRILETLAAPFRIHGREIGVGASLGIALFPNDGADAETLIKNADAAMNHAKNEGRNGYRFYTQAMNTTHSRRLALETHLRKALENAELRLHYQPQVEIASGRIVGVECLLRWHQPELGPVSPAEFIPLAEDTGLILPIGAWVLREACTQARAWQQPGLGRLRMAVNISSVQFRQPGFGASVRQILRETGLPSDCLELELTEGVLLRNNEEILRTLREIKEMGVHLSLDDFGTGYSSLSYLKRFPLDTLKIDRSFVLDLPNDPDNTAIASAIIAMAQSLKFQVIAEGVENEAQLAFLRGKGCDLVQGFLFSPAVPAAELLDMLRRQQPPAHAVAGN